MEMAKYILSILRSNLMVFYSWGSHNFYALPNGLRFIVRGFKFKGVVEVLYNEGSDLFDICLIERGVVKERIEGIYFDNLVEAIDRHVERTDTYEEDVEAWVRAAI